MQRSVIFPGFVRDALGPLLSRGMDTAPVLAEAGIDPALSGPVSNMQYGRLWLIISERIEDEFFGLAARPMRPGSFSLMCHAILHAPTLERALRRALRFLNVVLDDPRGALRLRDGQAEIVLADRDGPRPAFAYRTYWLILMGVLCWLVGRRLPLIRVDFAGSPPPDRADYHQFFGAPVMFGRPQSRMIFAGEYLTLPTIRDEQSLKSFLRAAPANILLRYRHDQELTMAIRNRLRADQPEDWPDFNEVAHDLGLSSASLRRRLRGEGQSFSAIRDEIRHRKAQQMLAGSGLPVAEIATLLGYREPSAFYRAFQKWSGVTPGAYRQTCQGRQRDD
ncbi:AraC family transcriptional regulator [Paracoccus sp. Z330]|uniref:AraC family transcriptional regulator n=1 Tax=Paracoccus onchidii TaxID=3017813 RepID=A0ABT4ZAW5_9RHOB|nr:AraC family transcriptional regulator [Paracoccus onchidii]MDB6176412.1 AraC family transcriptional regulator [Paracoccus onchidii]